MAKKKSVIAGEYVVSIADNGHVDVDRIPRNVKAALRDIAEAKNFPYDKTWTQRQLANKLLKEFGDGNTLVCNDYTVSKREDGGIDVIQSFSDGHVMAALRDIAEKIGFEYGKWNNHHMGRKLVDYLMEHKEEADKILQTPNGKLKEAEETVPESSDIETSVASTIDTEQSFDCYVLGINYDAEHLITVKKKDFPSIDDINEYNEEFEPLCDDEINEENIEDVFDRYDGPLNFIYECSGYERRLNITDVSDLRLVKLQSEEIDAYEAEEAYRKEEHIQYSVDEIDFCCRSIGRYDILNESSDKLLLRGTYPITCTAGFALRLPSGTQFDPSKLKITNNEEGGDPFLAFYDGTSLDYLFAGRHDADYEQDVMFTVYFDRQALV